MSDHGAPLDGGRLPLLDPRHLTDPQQEVYQQIATTIVPWSQDAGFHTTTDDSRLIGPLNPGLFSPAITARLLNLQAAEATHTTLSEHVRQVVILAVGAVWQAPYELYAHTAVARRAGLSERAIRVLAAGDGLPDDVSDQERIAQRYARQLAAERRVEKDLYNQAEAMFGRQGLVDITYLVGIYQVICGLLNAFDIPAPAPHT